MVTVICANYVGLAFAEIMLFKSHQKTGNRYFTVRMGRNGRVNVIVGNLAVTGC